MSKENNQVVNLYGAFNEEMKRMHELVKVCIQQNQHDEHRHQQMMGRNYGYQPSHDASAFWQRIVQMQDIMIAALQSHDPIIQEKVAELALTGTREEIKKSDDIPF